MLEVPDRLPARQSGYTAQGMAGWQSGHAADCKSVYAGSIPTPASNPLATAAVVKPVDTADLKSAAREGGHAGSSPARGTTFPWH